jgi:hypothetical protein
MEPSPFRHPGWVGVTCGPRSINKRKNLLLHSYPLRFNK